MSLHLGGLVLAGGLGSRMGHVNKGLQPWFTGRLIMPALEVLQQQCSYVAISANQDLEQYQALGVNVWPDALQWQGCGPLAGVISSVSHFPSHIDRIQIFPCDTPLLSAEVVAKLSDALQNGVVPAVYAQTRSQTHPVVCQFKREVMASLIEYLQQAGKHSIRRWLMQIGAEAVWFDEESQFANVNDVATLSALQAQNHRKEHHGLNTL
jgi:molybdopterin-guanine dinucleotide biosynthesis protein A